MQGLRCGCVTCGSERDSTQRETRQQQQHVSGCRLGNPLDNHHLASPANTLAPMFYIHPPTLHPPITHPPSPHKRHSPRSRNTQHATPETQAKHQAADNTQGKAPQRCHTQPQPCVGSNSRGAKATPAGHQLPSAPQQGPGSRSTSTTPSTIKY